MYLSKRNNGVNFFRCPEEILAILENGTSNVTNRHGIQATRLCTHKDDVDEMNNLKMKELRGELKVFQAVDSDSLFTNQMDRYLPVKQRLELKVGAQVFFNVLFPFSISHQFGA